MVLLKLRRRVADSFRIQSIVCSLRLLWVVAVLWCELGAFVWSLRGCHWPDGGFSNSTLATHVLIIADPQILDYHSYPGRSQWLMTVTQYMVDLNLRKSWNVVASKFDPHMVVFLGDMMDNGRWQVDDDDYSYKYHRFRSIFRLDRSIPVYYLPGNHDVDLGASSGMTSLVRGRYREHFGSMNHRVDIGNHTTLVLFDAPQLVDEDNRRVAAQADLRKWQGINGGAFEFLNDTMTHRPPGQLVLFSHIPFYRANNTSCGPLRESGTIRPGVGRGYQNTLLQEISSFILENIRPALIFSGDDHDYCDHHHVLADGSSVREVTVKSFSMAMGIRRPGFQLLSLGPAVSSNDRTSDSVTLADVPCLLPDQVEIYTHGYASFAVLTVLVLLLRNYRRHRGCQMDTAQMETQSSEYGESSSYDSDDRRELQRSQGLAGTYTDHLAPNDVYSLPLHALRPLQQTSREPSPEKRAFTGPFLVVRHSRSGHLRAVQAHWLGRSLVFDRRSWFCGALIDLCLVAWPPLVVYILINLKLFWTL